MSTIIAYSILTTITLMLTYKLYSANKKEPNDFRFYFLLAVAFVQLAQIIYVLSAISYYLLGNNSDILYWGDIIGKTLFVISSAGFIQMALSALLKKSKKIIISAYVYLFLAVLFFLFNSQFYYQPFINESGIIIWQTPEVINYFYIPIQLIPWLLIIGVFSAAYIQSKFKSKKSFLIATGSLTTVIGGILQDLAQNTLQFFLVNLLIFSGFLLVFIALFIRKEILKQ